MRFYVPNMEETESQQERNEQKQEKDQNDDKSDNSDDEITPAKIMNDQILQYAGIGDQAGDIIAQFEDLPLMVPRGKYTLEMYSNYAKFHGKTHDYKIMYKDIIKMF